MVPTRSWQRSEDEVPFTDANRANDRHTPGPDTRLDLSPSDLSRHRRPPPRLVDGIVAKPDTMADNIGTETWPGVSRHVEIKQLNGGH